MEWWNIMIIGVILLIIPVLAFAVALNAFSYSWRKSVIGSIMLYIGIVITLWWFLEFNNQWFYNIPYILLGILLIWICVKKLKVELDRVQKENKN